MDDVKNNLAKPSIELWKGFLYPKSFWFNGEKKNIPNPWQKISSLKQTWTREHVQERNMHLHHFSAFLWGSVVFGVEYVPSPSRRDHPTPVLRSPRMFTSSLANRMAKGWLRSAVLGADQRIRNEWTSNNTRSTEIREHLKKLYSWILIVMVCKHLV